MLAYRADEVPVGEDQREHLELMRDIARRFNSRFAAGEEVLKVPEHRIPEVGARIMDLQEPTRKMSTTGSGEQGIVYVLDEPEAILKKLRSAVTDSGSEIARGPEKPGISNLIEILAAVRGQDPAAVEAEYAGAALRRLQDGGRRGGGRLPGPDPRALRRAACRRGTAGGDPRRGGPAGARDRPRDARRRALADGRGRARRRPCAQGRRRGPVRWADERERPRRSTRAGPRPRGLQRALRPAADAGPARRGRPARARAGGGGPGLPGPPRALRRARPRERHRIHRPDRGPAGAEVPADAHRRGRAAAGHRARARPPRSCSRGCSTRAATAPPASTCRGCWPPSTECASGRRRCRPSCAAPCCRRPTARRTRTSSAPRSGACWRCHRRSTCATSRSRGSASASACITCASCCAGAASASRRRSAGPTG